MPASIETPAVIYITLLYRFRIIQEHSNLSLFTILKLTLSDVKYVPIAERKRFI
jgi:hypothetical protein